MLRKYGIGGQIRWTTWLSETPKIKKCGNLKSLVLKSWLEIHNIRKMRLGNPISGFKTLKFKLRNSRIMGLKLILKHPMIQFTKVLQRDIKINLFLQQSLYFTSCSMPPCKNLNHNWTIISACSGCHFFIFTPFSMFCF